MVTPQGQINKDKKSGVLISTNGVTVLRVVDPSAKEVIFTVFCAASCRWYFFNLSLSLLKIWKHSMIIRMDVFQDTKLCCQEIISHQAYSSHFTKKLTPLALCPELLLLTLDQPTSPGRPLEDNKVKDNNKPDKKKN